MINSRITNPFFNVDLRWKILFVLFFIISWLCCSYVKYIIFDSDNNLYLLGVYLLWVVWGFVFERSIPAMPNSIPYDPDNIGVLYIRGFAGWSSLILLVVINFFVWS